MSSTDVKEPATLTMIPAERRESLAISDGGREAGIEGVEGKDRCLLTEAEEIARPFQADDCEK